MNIDTIISGFSNLMRCTLILNCVIYRQLLLTLLLPSPLNSDTELFELIPVCPNFVVAQSKVNEFSCLLIRTNKNYG